MKDVSLESARAALEAGNPSSAIDFAWRAVRPAVLRQDVATIRETRAFAEGVAAQASGAAQDEAEQLAAYCTACILQPRDAQPSVWSTKRLFSWGSAKKTCPDCAERVLSDARVCRYCGYRFDFPSEQE